jgi:hypothetical protein
MKDSGEESKSAYEERVSWYNTIMSGVNRYIEKAGSNDDIEKGINSLLAKAITELEKKANPNYSFDEDQEAKNKIAEISKQIFKDRGIKLRNFSGEGRRNIIKFFSIRESASDFFDTRYKAVVAHQNRNKPSEGKEFELKEKVATDTRSFEVQQGMKEAKLGQEDRALLGSLKASNLPKVPDIEKDKKQGVKR